MRNILFKAVAFGFSAAIRTVDAVATGLKKFLGTVGTALMFALNRELLESSVAHLEEQENTGTELESQAMELTLLNTASQLRDHARENGGWTANHEVALENIGMALIYQFDWEEESAHQFIKEIVESIEGYEYGGPQDMLD